MFKHFFTYRKTSSQPSAEYYSAINTKKRGKIEQNVIENNIQRINFLVYHNSLEHISKVRNFALDFKNKGEK